MNEEFWVEKTFIIIQVKTQILEVITKNFLKKEFYIQEFLKNEINVNWSNLLINPKSVDTTRILNNQKKIDLKKKIDKFQTQDIIY